jgi:hypothetical protein
MVINVEIVIRQRTTSPGTAKPDLFFVTHKLPYMPTQHELEEVKTTTYRHWIQHEVRKLEERYDNAGGLRDHATNAEKKYWNEIRGALRETIAIYMRLDNSLEDWSAQTEMMPIPGEEGK